MLLDIFFICPIIRPEVYLGLGNLLKVKTLVLSLCSIIIILLDVIISNIIQICMISSVDLSLKSTEYPAAIPVAQLIRNLRLAI